MRLIDADKATEIARRVFDQWNLAMVGAETNKEINKVFKMQELFKAVMAVVEECPTVDPVKHGYWKECVSETAFGKQIVSKCSVCGCEYMMLSSVQPYCSECGSKMDDGDSNG